MATSPAACTVAAAAAAAAILLCCSVGVGGSLVPTVVPTGVRIIRGVDADGHYYRDLFVDEATDTLYIGARRYVYRVNLTNASAQAAAIQVESVLDPNPVVAFNDVTSTAASWATVADPEGYAPFAELLRRYNVSAAPPAHYAAYLAGLDLRVKLGDFLRSSRSFQYSGAQYGNNLLDVAEQYSSVAHSGIAAGIGYRSVCEAQLQVLQLFYGSSLPSVAGQIADVLCARHVRGLTWLNGGRTKLFSVATGLFGTMQLSVTGTNDYTSWLELDASYTAFLNCMETRSSATYPWLSCASRLKSPPLKQPLLARGAAAGGRGSNLTSAPTPQEQSVLSNWSSGFVPPSPENFLGRKRFCDPKPAPRRLNLRVTTGAQGGITVAECDPLVPTARDTCPSFRMASSFLSGHHPDQATFTLASDSGNGPSGNARAIYVLTEIGQEKQLDLNLDYLNLPETLPLSSSASLALLRLLVDNVTDDVIPGSVVMTNPFKYTWVTSPLTRWGKMVKSGSQEQVPHRPRAVRGMFERGQYVYFFFREVEWERMSLPEYSIARHHFQLNSYTRALYYPWEKSYTAADGRPGPYIKQEEEPGQTREELYAPPLLAWRHAWSQATVTGRVARVCKNDQGMPMGVVDASVFNLDPGLSLSSFQSFLKTKLTCLVPVPATPHIWRFRRDVTRSSDRGACEAVLQTSDELYGKDLHYRAVSRNETLTLVFMSDQQDSLRKYGKYYHLSHCKGYKWAYVPKPLMMSSAYVEYSELRDVQQVNSTTFYGVFSSPLSEEQQQQPTTTAGGSTRQPAFGSAVCSFTAADIEAAFAGSFKRRIRNAWRPFRPDFEGASVTPSPYSCDGDPELAKASAIGSMNVDFLDASQPIGDELRQFDMRGNSTSRLNFFEADVEGSRTMWNAVGASPVLSRSGVLFDKLVADVVGNYTVLFVATSSGDVYKILTWQQAQQTCWTTSADAMRAWLNGAYMKDVRENPLYPLYNRSADGTSFSSDLTMEKYLTFPDDFLYTSDWNCTPAAGSRLLSVLKPFGAAGGGRRKIWSMRLHKSSLLLGTDDGVLQVPIYDLCAKYSHCSTCAVDPYCTWSGATCASRFNASSGAVDQSQPWIADADKQCSGCQIISMNVTAGDDVVLPGFFGNSRSLLKWFFNGSSLVLQPGKLMTSENTSLILLNFSEEWSGNYELRDTSGGTCLVQYSLTLRGCRGTDYKCRYTTEFNEWMAAYKSFQEPAKQWYIECTKNGPGLCKGAS